MEQQRIFYKTIIDLDFTEEIEHDQLYIDEFGFEYCIIQKWLTKTIYLEWEKENQLCKLIRINNKKAMDIQKIIKIMDIDHLNQMIDFFEDKKDYSHCHAC